MMKLLPWLLALYLLPPAIMSVDAYNSTSIGTRRQGLIRPLLRRIVNKAEDCQSCSCGVSNNNRIVGGVESEINRYPWTAMFFSRGSFRCGGSLINNKYVLTAAHCSNPSEAEGYEVHFLQNRIDTKTPDTIIRKISEVIMHPNYSARTLENDMALLKLSQSIQFDDKIRPVCLPSALSSHSGQNAIVVGWGALQENGRVSQQIQEVSVPIITNKQCRDYGLKVTGGMICAGVQQGGKDSCQGDSGGPLHVVSNSKFTQAGIVSWGIGCGGPKRPGVYTKVSNYISWIRKNTADACTC